MKPQLCASLVGVACLSLSTLIQAGDIVHDAEYYVLEAQNGERWAAEDKSIAEKLAALQKNTVNHPT